MKSEAARASILVVCPHVPAFDSNAGDWRIYAFCRELSVHYRVCLLPGEWQAGSGRYAEGFARVGVEVLRPGYLEGADIPAIAARSGFSAVVFEWFHTVSRFLGYLPLFRKVVVDTHELYYRKARRRASVSGRVAGEPDWRAVRRHEFDMYRVADHLIAISAGEMRSLRRVFPRKSVSLMPMWSDPPGTPVASGFGDRSGMVFFGSFAHPEVNPNADAALYFVRELLPRIVRELPGVTFTVAGAGAERIRKKLLTNSCKKYIIIQNKIDNIPEFLSRFRVFVCPLRYGAGVKKKLLDAILSRCPVVTTPVGAEGLDLIPGKDMFVAADPESFAGSAIDVYRDEALWSAVADSAAAQVARRNAVGQGLTEIRQFVDGNETRIAQYGCGDAAGGSVPR